MAEKMGQETLKNPEDLLDRPKRQGVSVESILKKATEPSAADLKARLEMQQNLMLLDTYVSNCVAIGTEWLEYDPKVIAHLCGGEIPKAGYMIYKNIRLCIPGEAENIASREKMTIDQLMYIEDGKPMVGR